MSNNESTHVAGEYVANMSESIVYFDHAAATPMDIRVQEAMRPYESQLFFNPSSPYLPAVRVRRDFEQARSTLAHAIGGKPAEVVLTAGATESINLVFGSFEGHVVVSEIEHDSVLACAQTRDCTLVPVTNKGLIQLEAFEASLRPDTQLVSIGLANNEIGTVQPLRAVSQIVAQERQRRLREGNTTPLVFHTDASQGAGQINTDVATLGVDLMTLNAAKIYGPKQVGLLWAHRGIQLKPRVLGGGQERGLRSGTENVAGAVGFACALKMAVENRKEEAKHLTFLRDTLEYTLLQAVPWAVVSGHKKHRLPGHLHISFPRIDAERLVFILEDKGVLVGTGAACAANKNTRSHVLSAIGLAPEVADGSLRLTLGHLSNEENVQRGAAAIVEAVLTEKERVGL